MARQYSIVLAWSAVWCAAVSLSGTVAIITGTNSQPVWYPLVLWSLYQSQSPTVQMLTGMSTVISVSSTPHYPVSSGGWGDMGQEGVILGLPALLWACARLM